MAENCPSRARRWIVVAILVFPYSLLLGMISLFEYCAAKGST